MYTWILHSIPILRNIASKVAIDSNMMKQNACSRAINKIWDLPHAQKVFFQMELSTLNWDFILPTKIPMAKETSFK